MAQTTPTSASMSPGFTVRAGDAYSIEVDFELLEIVRSSRINERFFGPAGRAESHRCHTCGTRLISATLPANCSGGHLRASRDQFIRLRRPSWSSIATGLRL